MGEAKCVFPEPTPFSKAWNKWLASDEARKCLDGSATGVYLRNRLQLAFTAGFNASDGDERPT